MISRFRLRPSLEHLEDRTCPTSLTLRYTGGNLLITGMPGNRATGSSINITATADNQFTIQEKVGVTVTDNLGTYNVGSNLILELANHVNNSIIFNLNGHTYGGNIIALLGNGAPAGDPILIFGGTVGGNVDIVGGRGH